MTDTTSSLQEDLASTDVSPSAETTLTQPNLAARGDSRAREKLVPGTKIALAAMSLAIFAIALDFTALSVALPKMENELGVDVAVIQWVINAYAIVLGVLIVTGGRIADMFGRKRVFLIGSGVFAVFSLLAGIAESAGLLIAARAAMGIGGAVMWPAVLGMTYGILPKHKAAFAGGLIIGVAGLGNAFGPILGGVFTDSVSWRCVFLINVPIAIITSLIIARKVPADDPTDKHERIDYLGIITFSIGIVALLLALTQVTEMGWGDPYIIGLLCLTVLMLMVFALVERRAGRHGLLPPDVMKNKQFRAACFSILLISAVFFAALVYVPLFMVNLLEFSPFQAGLGLLPWMAVCALVSFSAGGLYKRFGSKITISAGALGLALGPFLLSFSGSDSTYADLVPGMVVLGIGVGLFYSSITTTAVTALDDSRSSLASGVLYMFQIVGGSIGLGVATTLFSSVSLDNLNSKLNQTVISLAQRNQIENVLSGKETPQHLLDQPLGNVLWKLYSEATSAGIHVIYLTVAGLAFLGCLTALLFVDRRSQNDGQIALVQEAS